MLAVENKTIPLGITLKNIFANTDMKIVDILSNVAVSRSFVERLFRGKESRFDLVLSIIKFLECDENELIRQYCEEIKMPNNFLYAMEYCDRRNDLDMLEDLIIRSEGQTLPELNEMRYLYKISLERKRNGREENLEKALHKVKTFLPSTTMSEVFQKLVEIHIHYQLREYGNVNNILKHFNIEKVNNAFFSESLRWRLNQIQQSITLRFDADIEKSRELAYELLKMSDSKYFHAFSYGNLGLSYAFTSQKDKALTYLNKSKQLYNEAGMKNDMWNETIEFFKILWNRPINPKEISSKKNLALLLIKTGKSYQAREIIDKIEIVEKTSPMSLFLKGLANQNADYHWLSLEMYIKERGDRLFALLPRNELIRLKQNKYGVNALYNILSKK